MIGNNVGMSSTRMWIHDSVTIGDNVKVRACVLITDADVCIGSRLSHGHYCFVCWRRKCTSQRTADSKIGLWKIKRKQ